jgi:hypothetical protein
MGSVRIVVRRICSSSKGLSVTPSPGVTRSSLSCSASLLRAIAQPSLLDSTTTALPFRLGRNTRSHLQRSITHTGRSAAHVEQDQAESRQQRPDNPARHRRPVGGPGAWRTGAISSGAAAPDASVDRARPGDTFKMFEEKAYEMGFSHAAVGAMVRSSYHADQQAYAAGVAPTA